MNTTTLRVARYAGAGLVGIAASGVLAAPALAMRLDPIPGDGQVQIAPHPDQGTANSLVGTTTPTPASDRAGSASDGIDWSSLAAGFGGGAMLTGVVVFGAKQFQRHQARPA